MHTVSTDLARRLQVAGLKHEWQRGDWAFSDNYLEAEAGLVIGVREQRGITLDWGDGWMSLNSDDCLWLPTGDDCLEAMRARGLYPAIAAYPETVAWPAWWGCWANNRADKTVVSMCEHAELAEAAGLALAAVLEEEKAR